MARKPRYMPMNRSDRARLQIRNLVTSSLDLLKMDTNRTVPLPSTASRNTTQTPQRSDHHPNKSSHGWNGSESVKVQVGVSVCRMKTC